MPSPRPGSEKETLDNANGIIKKLLAKMRKKETKKIVNNDVEKEQENTQEQSID